LLYSSLVFKVATLSSSNLEMKKGDYHVHFGGGWFLGKGCDVINAENETSRAIGQCHSRVSVSPISVGRPFAVHSAVISEHVQLFFVQFSIKIRQFKTI
jgi:hypothetical protein